MKPGTVPIKEWARPTWEKDDMGDWVGPGQPSLIGPRTPYWHLQPVFVDRCLRRFQTQAHDLRERPEILEQLIGALTPYGEAVKGTMYPLKLRCNERVQAPADRTRCLLLFVPAYAAFGGFLAAAKLVARVRHPTLQEGGKPFWH